MKSCIVKRKATLTSLLPIFLILLVSAVLTALFMQIFSFVILIAGVIAALALMPSRLFTEYEYNLEGEQLSVALIRNKSSRKELFSADISNLVSCAPYEPHLVTGVKIDVSTASDSRYVAVFSEEGKTASVIFSPTNDFMQSFRLLAPSRVKLNIL